MDFSPIATLAPTRYIRHDPDFLAALAERGQHLPAYVREGFEAYLKCGQLEHGFLRIRCTSCHHQGQRGVPLPKA